MVFEFVVKKVGCCDFVLVNVSLYFKRIFWILFLGIGFYFINIDVEFVLCIVVIFGLVEGIKKKNLISLLWKI